VIGVEIDPPLVWSLLRETASRWSGHKASLLGAAIAYYSVFSLGPLMVIAIAIARRKALEFPVLPQGWAKTPTRVNLLRFP
jgi:hypothetical protein